MQPADFFIALLACMLYMVYAIYYLILQVLGEKPIERIGCRTLIGITVIAILGIITTNC